VEAVLKLEVQELYGLQFGAGVVLLGPQGCGKALPWLGPLLLRRTMRRSSAGVVEMKRPELLNKYLAESEQAVRALLRRAKESIVHHPLR
jgi:ribosome biogenesis ATPase